MKLNYKRTLLVGFAFFLICAFWQAYDNIIPKILTDKFGLPQTWSGAIMALDKKYRMVIVLYYFEGYSISEIAALLDLPPATVGTRLSRARNKLKDYLTEACCCE